MQCTSFFLFLLLGLLPLGSDLLAAPLMLGTSGDQRRAVIVDNRILAKVHGKAISVIDVQKKMDVMFHRRFPEYASLPAMRLQFYLVNWRHMLSDLIDKELVLSDAKESKLEVTKGEVRKEIELMFGPNVMANLDAVGLTYDEAREMVEGDLLIRRMMGMRVNMKANQRVSPKEIRRAYEDYAVNNKRPTEWVYRIITVRHPDEEEGQRAADLLRNQLTGNRTSIDALAQNYQKLEALDPDVKVTFSEEMHHKDSEISETYRETLSNLRAGAYSQPIAQVSRKGETVQRIFYLKEVMPGGVVPLAEVEGKLQDKLLGEAVAAETEAYLGRLRKQAGLTKDQLEQLVPTEFQPFSLK